MLWARLNGGRRVVAVRRAKGEFGDLAGFYEELSTRTPSGAPTRPRTHTPYTVCYRTGNCLRECVSDKSGFRSFRIFHPESTVDERALDAHLDETLARVPHLRTSKENNQNRST